MASELDKEVMAIQNNEGKACDAVVKLLEKRTRKVRADVSCPEKTGIGPPVELRLHLGSQSYAVEHTQIEAFADQIHTAEEFGRFISPVTNELSGTLPGPAVVTVLVGGRPAERLSILARAEGRKYTARQVGGALLRGLA